MLFLGFGILKFHLCGILAWGGSLCLAYYMEFTHIYDKNSPSSSWLSFTMFGKLLSVRGLMGFIDEHVWMESIYIRNLGWITVLIAVLCCYMVKLMHISSFLPAKSANHCMHAFDDVHGVPGFTCKAAFYPVHSSSFWHSAGWTLLPQVPIPTLFSVHQRLVRNVCM